MNVDRALELVEKMEDLMDSYICKVDTREQYIDAIKEGVWPTIYALCSGHKSNDEMNELETTYTQYLDYSYGNCYESYKNGERGGGVSIDSIVYDEVDSIIHRATSIDIKKVEQCCRIDNALEELIEVVHKLKESLDPAFKVGSQLRNYNEIVQKVSNTLNNEVRNLMNKVFETNKSIPYMVISDLIIAVNRLLDYNDNVDRHLRLSRKNSLEQIRKDVTDYLEQTGDEEVQDWIDYAIRLAPDC